MAGRDTLPHYPEPKRHYQQQQQQPPQQAQRPPPRLQQQTPQSHARMYSGTYGQPAAGGAPGAYPQAGYQVGPPGTYGVAQQSTFTAQAYVTTSPPPQGVDPELYRLFKAADTNNSGQLSEKELGRALVNGDYTAFDVKTVKLMVNMFDVDRSGTIGLDEFVGLWGYLNQWRTLFTRFDVDNSGAIDRREFATALNQFGYRLSDGFVGVLFTSYDKKGNGQMGFDMFVQSMVTVKTLTDVFKTLDTDRDGFITIGFEQFLDIILRQRT